MSMPVISNNFSSDLMFRVQKPVRYLGQELNTVRKDPKRVDLRIALAFPDLYEIGQSHLGLKILYAVVNAYPKLYGERVFAPSPDMEQIMRATKEPLRTLETGTPLYAMDFVGFSLQYELAATTVLLMLDLGGIPLRAGDRSKKHPFIVGGGPIAFNPLPLTPFFDAFAIGDGEELIVELAQTQVRWKKEGGDRKDLLSEWKKIPGVFVPDLHREGEIIHRRILPDLERAPFPTRLVVPYCEIVHDRVGIEISRGCTRGCRFCQAGMLYRPVRERSPERILELTQESVSATGWEEVALLSLSSGDYSGFEQLIQDITSYLALQGVALSLPSLRTDTFSESMAAQIRKVRKTGFTLAPEAGTERLRRIINKGNTEEDLRHAISTAFAYGWQAVKLYFMIGLPTESEEDLDGIIDLIFKAARWAQGGKITASVSTFVPKSHTPFQWAEQIPAAETRRRQAYLRNRLRRRSVQLKFHDERISFLEGVIARGDNRLSDVIECAYRKGARLDSWDDQLRFPLWEESFGEKGISPEDYLEARNLDIPLPWEFIATGLRREFLVNEWHKAINEETTPDCRWSGCAGCGVCDFQTLKPIIATDSPFISPQQKEGNSGTAKSLRRFRLRYARWGTMRFIGHQDIIRLFHRAFRRAGIALAYSQGFHPHPKLMFSPPLAFGVESHAELLDFDITDTRGTNFELLNALCQELPEGITPLTLEEISLNTRSISAKQLKFRYEMRLDGTDVHQIERQITAFQDAESFGASIGGTNKGRRRDIKPFIEGLKQQNGNLMMTVLSGQSGTVNPLDAFAAVLGMEREKIRSLGVVKTDVQICE